MELTLSLSTSILFFACGVVQGAGPSTSNANERKFTAVTYFPEILELYRKLREDKNEIREQDVTTSVEAKNRICQEISTSGYFRLRNDAPIDMTRAYDVMKTLLKTEHQPKFRFYETILGGYERKHLHLFTNEYSHPAFAMASLGFGEPDEYMTVCLTTHTHSIRQDPDVNFVTDAYNLLEGERGYIGGRFVFRNDYNSSALIALAEEPAVDVFFPQSTLEGLYRKMRLAYKSTDEESQDPLCGLTTSQKLRVCTSVMNSGFFEILVRYFPDHEHFQGFCRKRKVFLGIDEPGSVPYEEWMLPCTAERIDAAVDSSTQIAYHSTYFVSRAYNSQMAFAYRCRDSTNECFLLNISKNISVIVDKCKPPDCIEI